MLLHRTSIDAPAGQLLTRRHSSVEDGMLLHCYWFLGVLCNAQAWLAVGAGILISRSLLLPLFHHIPNTIWMY